MTDNALELKALTSVPVASLYVTLAYFLDFLEFFKLMIGILLLTVLEYIMLYTL
jgi:type IV secretory pathway TrbL component